MADASFSIGQLKLHLLTGKTILAKIPNLAGQARYYYLNDFRGWWISIKYNENRLSYPGDIL